MRAAQQFPFLDEDLFPYFFGPQFRERGPAPRPEFRQEGLGSGVIVSDDGYILTNHHVIDGAEEIHVDLVDGRSFKARVVGSDPPSDLAVLKIEANGLTRLSLGDSDSVRVGDVVLAVGNPLGVGQTVTMGIISAKGRSTGLSDGSFEDFLQTDAPINRGNSGGALVSSTGELVGIACQILSPSGGNIGIGFAIPANMARTVMDSLVKDGQVKRGMLGVAITDVTAEMAPGLKLKEAQGALVSSVQAESPAARAGIKPGDVIVGLNGQKIQSSNGLRNRVAQSAPGSKAKVSLFRDGAEVEVTVTLAELPRVAAGPREPRPEPSTLPLGLTLQATPEGPRVTSVVPGSPADLAGIRRGDVLLEVNRKPVADPAAVQAALEGQDGPVFLLLARENKQLFVVVPQDR